jgi:hypothetical protein
MTNKEMELFRVALHHKKAYDDCNPQVGIGPSMITLARRLAEELSFAIDDDDLDEVCEHAGIF